MRVAIPSRLFSDHVKWRALPDSAGLYQCNISVDICTRQPEAKLRWLNWAVQELHRTIPNTEQIHPYKVLKAMLDHAPTERSERFVACSIICCGEVVSNSWVWQMRFLVLVLEIAFYPTHFLCSQICIYGRNHPLSVHSTPSLSSTPLMTTVSEQRRTGFVEDVWSRFSVPNTFSIAPQTPE